MSIIVQHRRDTRANCEANTPAVGELWYDTTLKATRIGDGATLGGFLQKRWRYSYPLSPAQIIANQNDYNPADLQIGETLFLNSDVARSITGIAGGAAGARITLINRGVFDITLVNASGLSIAANQFLFESDVVLRPYASIQLQYSATDARWMRADGGIKFSTVPQEFLQAGVITPAQITANQNNYAPVDSVTATKTTALASILRLSSDASRDITGLVDPRDGVVKIILNAGSQPIVLKNADVGSDAANRFDFGADLTLAGKQSARIRYDGTDSRWKLEAQTAGSAVGAGAVTAQTLSGSALGFAMVNGTIVESHAAGACTIAIKTLAGADPSAADPVLVKFRNATLATGDYTMMSVTAPTSIVISSGSSLGAINNIPFTLWLVGFNDAGTFRLGVINTSGNQYLGLVTSEALVSSTAEGGAGAADSAGVFYTGTAVASKPMAALARLDWANGLAAVGTWGTSPSAIQLTPAPVLPSQLPASAFGAFAGLVNGTIVPSVAASALTIAVKTLAGADPSIADPVYALFRNATAATGDYVVLAINAATSLVISSGSTMGAPSINAAFKLWVVGFNDAGTFRLGAINCMLGTDLSIYPLSGFGIASSTAEGGAGAADSAQVFYTGAAVASKAYMPLAYMSWEAGLAALGTWVSPTRTQLFGHGVPLPGTVVGSVRTASGSVASGATTVPLDDSIPQSTEGDQYMSKDITPSSAAHVLRIRALAQLNNSASVVMIASLFQDAVANALSTAAVYIFSAGAHVLLSVQYAMLARTSVSTTFKLRAGGHAAGTTTFNGNAAARQFGGACTSNMEIEEIAT